MKPNCFVSLFCCFGVLLLFGWDSSEGDYTREYRECHELVMLVMVVSIVSREEYFCCLLLLEISSCPHLSLVPYRPTPQDKTHRILTLCGKILLPLLNERVAPFLHDINQNIPIGITSGDTLGIVADGNGGEGSGRLEDGRI